MLFIECIYRETLPSSPYVTLDPIEQTNTSENPANNGKLPRLGLAGAN